MHVGQEKRQPDGKRWLTLQIAGAAVFSVGIIAFSWLNPGWQPWSARAPAEPEKTTIDPGPARQGQKSDPALSAAVAPERIRALLSDAQQHVDAGDPVTGALLALEVLRYRPEPGLEPADRAAVQRILYEAHFNRKERMILNGQIGFIHSAAFSTDGTRVVTAASDRTVAVYAVRDGAMIVKLNGHDDEVRSAHFSPDGQLIASASFDGTVRVWDFARRSEAHVLRGHTDKVVAVTFSPDGQRLVSASYDATARIWNVADGVETAVLKGHGGRVLGAVFSPDGQRILTASEDTTARLWDATNGKPIAVLRGHNGAVVFSKP